MASFRPWLLALLSAVALPLGFVGFDWWPLALAAYVPLFMAVDRVKPGRAALLGLFCGFLANAIGHAWLPRTIHVFGGLSWTFAWFLGCLLFAYQGLVFALVATVLCRLRRAGHSVVWAAPLSVVAVESVFPLVLPIFMGSSFHRFSVVIQAVDLFGPQFLTAVLVLCNVSILGVWRATIGRRAPNWVQIMAGPLAVALSAVYGVVRIPVVERTTRAADSLTIGVVQPDVGIFEKWHRPLRGLHHLRTASRRLEDRGAELLIWPEAAYTVRPIDRAAASLPGDVFPGLRTPLIFGSLTTAVASGRSVEFNSAVMAEPSGRVLGIYDKVHLVTFSETLPGADVLPWVYELSPVKPRLQSGSGPEVLSVDIRQRQLRVAPLICFEDLLPGFTRSVMRRTGANLMVNLTNDAWFGDSPAARIHFTLSRFRAIEHRRYLVRATNNGVTAVVDPCGRVAARLPARQPAEMIAEVRLLDVATVYGRLGNVFGYGCALIAVWLLWRSRRVVPPAGGKDV